MIHFDIVVRNPAWQNRFASIKTWAGSTPWPNKYWEVQLVQDGELLCVEFEWTTRCDHAGATLELGLLGYKIAFSFYDHRHWDIETNSWNKHD